MIQLAVYDTRNGDLLADWSGLAEQVVFTTNEHGFATLTATIPLLPVLAFSWFDRPGLPWIEAVADGMMCWRGRLEDVRLVDVGIEIVALGAWSVLGDVPYTATPASPVNTDVIVKAILTAARVDNPTLLHASDLLIAASGMAVHNEDFVDADMRTVLTRLAFLGSTTTDPLRWEVGFWDHERLFFRARGSAGESWYADVAELDLERSLGQVYNSAYTRYASGASVTATADDTESITRYGVTRRKARTSETTNGTQAAAERDAVLADSATPTPRAAIVIAQIFTRSGARGLLWNVRAGDTITLQNLPPESGELVDRVRTFVIAETRYTCDTHTLEITPEAPAPRLDILVARSLEVAE